LPVDGGGAVAKSALASMGRRRLMAVAGTLRILSQVDENLFGTLKLPESARAAIRRINQEHKSKAQEFLSSPDGGVAQLEAAEQARRAAIDTVLDADVAKDFHAGELAATHSLRRQARFGQPGATGGPGAPPPPDGGMPTVGVDQAGGQSATFSSPSPTTPPVVVAPVVVTPAPTPPTPSVPGQPATDGPPSGEPPLDPTPSANPVN
jgi:hypothetical protein